MPCYIYPPQYDSIHSLHAYIEKCLHDWNKLNWSKREHATSTQITSLTTILPALEITHTRGSLLSHSHSHLFIISAQFT